jgi:hypothetical protein
MHAEYAVGSPELEAFEEPEFFAVLLVPICATFAPDEPPPHAAVGSDSPTTLASTSPRSALSLGSERPRFVTCVLCATIAISSPCRANRFVRLSRLYEMGSCSTVTSMARLGGLRRSLGPVYGSVRSAMRVSIASVGIVIRRC